jgi:hypothetical protein
LSKTQQEQEENKKQIGHKFYTKFYWCDFCRCWIKKDKAKMVEKRIRIFPCCPKPSCNLNRLKTQSTNYKYKCKDDAERRSQKEY